MNTTRKQTTRKKATRYVEYDYEAAYQDQLDREDAAMVETLIRKGAKAVYATKRVTAGDQVELEIYPEFTRKEDVPEEGRRSHYNAKAQRNLKDKNAKKHCERLINENFASGDLWITLTYTDRNLPKSMDEALANVQKYIKRINYKRKTLGLPSAKYVYITEWSEDEKTGLVRAHHHMVMDGDMPMDEVEKAWKLGKRNKITRLDYDENGLTGLAQYIMKDPKGRRRWCASKNLKQPKERKNHYQFTRKKVERMAFSHEDAVAMVKAAAPGCIFKSLETKCNEVNGFFYFRAKLRSLCKTGDMVTVRDAESMGFDGEAVYEITATEGPDAWIRRYGGRGKPKKIPLEHLHAAKGRRSAVWRS